MSSSFTGLDLQPGHIVGGYTLLSRLDQGGMGTIWRVRDDGGSIYAMKVLMESLSDDDDTRSHQDNLTARERFRREAIALQSINHPGVNRIVDMELDDSVAFIVTELIEGKNLRDDVYDNGRYTAEDLEALARKLIDAVDAVHNAGIIHRDIKPTNVMISADGPVLVDFGIAMGENQTHVTHTGLVMGTPGFIAPEIIDGAESDEATDWWSVTSVLGFAATGRPIFGSQPMMAVLEREASGNADLSGLPEHTMRTMFQALDPERMNRCSAQELLAAIARDAQYPDLWDNGDEADAIADATTSPTVPPADSRPADRAQTKSVMPPFGNGFSHGLSPDAPEESPEECESPNESGYSTDFESEQPLLEESTATRVLDPAQFAQQNTGNKARRGYSDKQTAIEQIALTAKLVTDPTHGARAALTNSDLIEPTRVMTDTTHGMPATRTMPAHIRVRLPEFISQDTSSANDSHTQYVSYSQGDRAAQPSASGNFTSHDYEVEDYLAAQPKTHDSYLPGDTRDYAMCLVFAIPLIVLGSTFPTYALALSLGCLWLLTIRGCRVISALRSNFISPLKLNLALPWHMIKSALLATIYGIFGTIALMIVNFLGICLNYMAPQLFQALAVTDFYRLLNAVGFGIMWLITVPFATSFEVNWGVTAVPRFFLRAIDRRNPDRVRYMAITFGIWCIGIVALIVVISTARSIVWNPWPDIQAWMLHLLPRR